MGWQKFSTRARSKERIYLKILFSVTYYKKDNGFNTM